MQIVFENSKYELVVADVIQFLEAQGFRVTTEFSVSVPEEPDEDVKGAGEPEKAKPAKGSKKGKPEKEPDEGVKGTGEPEETPETETGVEAQDTETVEEVDGAMAKSKEIDILMKLYNDGKSSAVKDLLAEFDVKKFGDLPDDRGHELLTRTHELADAA